MTTWADPRKIGSQDTQPVPNANSAKHRQVVKSRERLAVAVGRVFMRCMIPATARRVGDPRFV